MVTTRKGPQAMRHDGKPTVEVIGPEECPILFRRTLFDWGWCKLLLHEFLPGAADRDQHDHPRGFVTFCWRGGYDDISMCARCKGKGQVQHLLRLGGSYDGLCPDCIGTGIGKVDVVRAPALRYRSATHAHITQVHEEGARTIVVMGRLRRAWGFWREGRWYPWRLYDQLFSHGGFRCPD